MKALLILPVFLLIFSYSNAQTPTESDDFVSYTKDLNKKVSAAVTKKAYADAARLNLDWLSQYEKLSPQTKADFNNGKVGIYYNLACYTAMQGKDKEAIDFFEKAVQSGYSDYKHTLIDTDLNNLRSLNKFKTLLQQMREKDFTYILQKSGAYQAGNHAKLPTFKYQSSTSPELIKFKAQFNLDSVSGNGDELSKIKNLLTWAHNTVRHDGSSNNPKERNGPGIIAICKKEDRGVNCRMMATILRDAYQATGFKSRMVTCMPKDTADNDCHVINVVWANSLKKWVWMDPTFNAFVSDDKGNLLSISEVRERLISDKPLVLNEDANWNNQQKQSKAQYLDYYMSKNLYWIKCAVESEWDLETRKGNHKVIQYINLYPGGYSTINHQPKKQTVDMEDFATNDPEYFWQNPGDL